MIFALALLNLPYTYPLSHPFPQFPPSNTKQPRRNFLQNQTIITITDPQHPFPQFPPSTPNNPEEIFHRTKQSSPSPILCTLFLSLSTHTFPQFYPSTPKKKSSEPNNHHQNH
ncbi:hypothetical protein HAX54_047689 [Datura stramonium]|uniref:Uncharacterized protein n=1 Tax=Datura stramonium TaxID=4076 RepID=A0ABS8WII2_DATST|nr:hypothetical protein [Datura stramonium]